MSIINFKLNFDKTNCRHLQLVNSYYYDSCFILNIDYKDHENLECLSIKNRKAKVVSIKSISPNIKEFDVELL